jgi:hypothetical protein
VRRLWLLGPGPAVLAVVLTSVVATRASGQAQTPAPPPAPTSLAQTPAPPPAPARPPIADAAVDPDARVATGQAPIVGGNAAGARGRALEDAIRQVVDLAINDLADPPTRAAQGKAIRALEAKAHSFVGRYRTLEEREENGAYMITIQAEVDSPALRSKIERWNAAPVLPPPRVAALSIAVFAGDRTLPAFAAAVAAALSSAGVHARLADPGTAPSLSLSPSPSGPSATVTASTTDEGALRGTGRVSVACRAAARFTNLGLPLPDRAATARAFADGTEAGRTDCLTRLAGLLAADMAGALSGSAGAASDLPVLTIDADVVEPAAVSALLKSVRAVGAVSAADLVRVGGGRAEIRARTRAASAPVAAALSRDADAMISLSDVQTSGAVIRLRARLRAPATPETGSNP